MDPYEIMQVTFFHEWVHQAEMISLSVKIDFILFYFIFFEAVNTIWKQGWYIQLYYN